MQKEKMLRGAAAFESGPRSFCKAVHGVAHSQKLTVAEGVASLARAMDKMPETTGVLAWPTKTAATGPHRKRPAQKNPSETACLRPTSVTAPSCCYEEMGVVVTVKKRRGSSARERGSRGGGGRMLALQVSQQ
jgi:hypothetical protein